MKYIPVLCIFGLLASTANASPEGAARRETLVLATDDVYDCAAAPNGSAPGFVAATAGGLVVGQRVLTALDGLPDTRVEQVSFEGSKILATTRKGAVFVSWPDLRVLREPVRGVTAPVARAEAPVTFVGSAMVRAQHKTDRGTCYATDQGLLVAERDTPQAGSRAERYALGRGSLPSANVAALAEDGDALFIGTFDAGLVRRAKDGSLSAVDAKNPNINALHWDPRRRVLWVGTARGLVRCEDGVRCTRIGDAVGVHALSELSDGSVAAGGEGSLAFYAADGSRQGSLSRKQGLPFRAVWALARATDGTLYVGTTSGLYYAAVSTMVKETADKVPFQRVSMARGELPDDWVTALATSGSSVYVGTYNAGLVAFKRDGDALKREAAHPSLGYVNPAGISVLGSGELAVATMSGLKVGRPVDAGVFRRVPTLGEDVTGVVPARDGTSWIATRRGVMSVHSL